MPSRGGVPELVEAVVDYSFTEIRDTFSRQPVTDDPVSDLFSLALSTVAFARSNPHPYDAMFGLSTRATYRPAAAADVRRAGHSPAFQAAYTHLVTACGRLAESGRMTIDSPNTVASSGWSVIHGYITLELAEHFVDFSDPIVEVLVPMAVTFCIGLGDTPQMARASHESALGRFGSRS